jgi:hypothetical protein
MRTICLDELKRKGHVKEKPMMQTRLKSFLSPYAEVSGDAIQIDKE